MSENVENVNFLFADSNRKNMKDLNNLNPGGKSIVESYDPSLSLKGFVQIYENDENGDKELIEQNSNLIVYPGRVHALCRMMNKDLSNAGVYQNMKDLYVSYFAIGRGGAASNSNQNPYVVNSTDFGLSTHGTLTGATKRIVVNGKDYIGFDDNYPKFLPEPEILNNSDILDAMRSDSVDTGTSGSNKRDSYLISNIQVTLAADAANGSTGSQEINEAGLFLSPNSDPNSTRWRTSTGAAVDEFDGMFASRDLEMFARVTFPTITKNSARSFTISWYIFF